MVKFNRKCVLALSAVTVLTIVMTGWMWHPKCELFAGADVSGE